MSLARVASTRLRRAGDIEKGFRECLFFGLSDDGCQCAIEASAVLRVDSRSGNRVSVLSLQSLGFKDASDFSAPRILQVSASGAVVPVAFSAAVTTRTVPSEQLFALAQRPYGVSVFSALIFSDVHGRALLLDPKRLLHFYMTHVDFLCPVSEHPI
jgi:hypothetical protein